MYCLLIGYNKPSSENKSEVQNKQNGVLSNRPDFINVIFLRGIIDFTKLFLKQL